MIPPLRPTFDAALRDVRASQPRFRRAAAGRLAEPPAGRESEAAEGLRALARDPDGEVRSLAFESIGLLQVVDAEEVLLLGFDDRYPPARQAAVMALAQIDPERASDSIAPLLTDPRPEMRFSALWALSMLGPRHAARIAAALDDRDPEVRLAAAQCLGELGVSELADRLAPVLDDPDKSVEFGVATTLASLGDPRGAPLLRAALRVPAPGGTEGVSVQPNALSAIPNARSPPPLALAICETAPRTVSSPGSRNPGLGRRSCGRRRLEPWSDSATRKGSESLGSWSEAGGSRPGSTPRSSSVSSSSRTSSQSSLATSSAAPRASEP